MTYFLSILSIIHIYKFAYHSQARQIFKQSNIKVIHLCQLNISVITAPVPLTYTYLDCLLGVKMRGHKMAEIWEWLLTRWTYTSTGITHISQLRTQGITHARRSSKQPEYERFAYYYPINQSECCVYFTSRENSDPPFWKHLLTSENFESKWEYLMIKLFLKVFMSGEWSENVLGNDKKCSQRSAYI